MLKKLLIALSAVGPGLFLIGYNIGTGSITTMGMAGAQYGMTLLWALILSVYLYFNGGIRSPDIGNRQNRSSQFQG